MRVILLLYALPVVNVLQRELLYIFYVLCRLLCVVSSHRESRSCTHVSALLHSLASLNVKHLVGPTTGDGSHSSEDELPCTSQPCKWKKPKQRKESTILIEKAEFVKHDYAKPMIKRCVILMTLTHGHLYLEALLAVDYLNFR